eukprot:5119726-Prymnesium_polylepis.1
MRHHATRSLAPWHVQASEAVDGVRRRPLEGWGGTRGAPAVNVRSLCGLWRRLQKAGRQRTFLLSKNHG